MKTEHHIRTPDFLRTPKATSISEETKVNGLEKKIKELASELNRERSKLKESREYIRFLQRQVEVFPLCFILPLSFFCRR